MNQMPSDPVIDEVREVRRRLSASFDHDPAQLVAYYMEKQKQYQDRLIKTQGVLKIATNQQRRPISHER